MTEPRLRTVARIAIHALLAVVVASAAGYAYLRFVEKEVAVGSLVIRLQRGSTHPFPVDGSRMTAAPGGGGIASASVGAVDAGSDPAESAEPAVRNVVVVIGDGMGLAQVSTTSTLIHGRRGGLAFEGAPVTGLMKTWAANTLATDSAASGTAMATGYKTNNRVVSLLPDGRKVRTLLEAARAQGMATGVVTTAGLVDATPACFATHAPSRKRYGMILEGMLHSGAEVLIGGDRGVFEKPWDDLGPQQLQDLLEQARSDGYTIVRSTDELQAASGDRVLALFPGRPGWGANAHGPALAVTARKALEILARDDDGFVVMIESEMTDGAGHDNDIAGLVEAVREFDEAVQVVLEFAGARDDTLVLVTADHETGGVAIVDGDYDDGLATIRWATDYHATHWVPVFAFGPGAERFAGVLDNTDIARSLGDLLALEGLPAVVEAD